MATRSLLLDEDIPHARALLGAGAFPADASARARAFGAWLGERVLARLRAIGDFEALRPVRLGSWARGELCPKSDVDLLFLGDPAAVADFVSRARDAGLNVRARVPADPDDWTAGVEPFDVLALTDAELKFVVTAPWRARVRTAVRRERDERRRRHDSVVGFLEPNLKFGPGGLRDVTQALALARLYPNRFVDVDAYPFELLNSIKDELLVLRAHLHLNGGGDVLSATDQIEVGRALGLAPAELMRHVQSQLERASFYGDWITARVGPKPPRPAPKLDVRARGDHRAAGRSVARRAVRGSSPRPRPVQRLASRGARTPGAAGH